MKFAASARVGTTDSSTPTANFAGRLSAIAQRYAATTTMQCRESVGMQCQTQAGTHSAGSVQAPVPPAAGKMPALQPQAAPWVEPEQPPKHLHGPVWFCQQQLPRRLPFTNAARRTGATGLFDGVLHEAEAERMMVGGLE
jgi:hypothetical protein